MDPKGCRGWGKEGSEDWESVPGVETLEESDQRRGRTEFIVTDLETVPQGIGVVWSSSLRTKREENRKGLRGWGLF